MTSARPNLKAVATAAGVSPSTVSNAYNKPEQLSADLRERILDLAADMGYAGPDPTASSLRGGRSGSIGVLFAQELSYAFSDPYCAEMLTGVAETVTQTSTNMLLMPVGRHTNSRASSREAELALVQVVRQAALDGVIADGLDGSHPVLRVLTERGVPIVSSYAVDGRCVFIDDEAAAIELGNHLRVLGHRRCAVIGDSMGGGDPVVGPAEESQLFPYSRMRTEGLRKGLGPDAQVLSVSAGTNRIESGRAAAAAVLALSPRPTVIAATTDILALGALEALRGHGVRIGAEVSVTGFDDTAAAADAGLTTVRQPVREKGRVMARMLTDPTFTETRVVLPTELMIRTSAVAPA